MEEYSRYNIYQPNVLEIEKEKTRQEELEVKKEQEKTKQEQEKTKQLKLQLKIIESKRRNKRDIV